MTKRGCFIVVEGLEGAGKSTAIQTISKHLENNATKHILTREPGGTKVGEAVRTLIKDINESLDPRAELLLFYAARVQLLEQIIYPALIRGQWVIADRFELSSYAYQGGGRHLDRQMITTLSHFCLGNFKPDLLFFLDIEPSKGLDRVKLRGSADRMEQETLAFFEEVYQSYHQLIKTMENVICIDANQSLEKVQERIIAELERFITNHATTKT